MITIDSIEAENLRGYEHTILPLKELTILVGENNEGKSSLLKMFDRFMKIEPDFWAGERILGDVDFEFWYPANDARHQARRLTVNIIIRDGRVARKFGSKKNLVIPLRFAVSSKGECRLNVGPPARNESHSEIAVELLAELKRNYRVILLPPVRDAQSSAFTQKVTYGVKEQLQSRMSHSGRQAGAPKEYRLIKSVIENIKEVVSLHSKELARSNDSPLASMLKSSEVRVDVSPSDIYSMIERSLTVYLSTGEHDELKVLPNEVGNGLQSLIDINMTIESLLNEMGEENIIVVIEEPESFLHPSAQRQFMQYLRRALANKVQFAILTTHSPIILDEAKYEEIVLVRNQKHFAPADEHPDRASINSSLMTTASSEVFFARTVIFVEGEGDRAFLNTLLRRIKGIAPVSQELAGVVFQVAGGCTFYAPWLKLVQSYEQSGKSPFLYFWIMDGDVAHNHGQRPVLRTLRECGFKLRTDEEQQIIRFGDLGWEEGTRNARCNIEANKVLGKYGGYLFACDLEWALFNGASSQVVKPIKRALSKVGIQTKGTNVELARRLGSKIDKGKSSDAPKKQPYIRSLIAEELDLSNLPPEVFNVIDQIFLACYGGNKRKVSALFTSCGISAGTNKHKRGKAA